MAERDPLALDQQLCFALYSASRALTNRYRPLLDELGLTYPQYLVMLALFEHGALSVKDLGTHLRLDSGTLSPLLKRMSMADLVHRTRSTADERSVVIELTERGAALRDRIGAIRGSLVDGLGCTADELVELRTGLIRFVDGLSR
ncbi:MAG: MarR family transcriptional regulator [Actinomycetota bacterium]|nr:MarR family transcriptional regulator [Actinomycetota bacterium]